MEQQTRNGKVMSGVRTHGWIASCCGRETMATGGTGSPPTFCAHCIERAVMTRVDSMIAPGPAFDRLAFTQREKLYEYDADEYLDRLELLDNLRGEENT